MRFSHQVLKIATRRSGLSFFSAWKSLAFRLQGKYFRHPIGKALHVKFLLRMWLLILSIPFRLRLRKETRVILYNTGGKPEERIYFYRKFAAPSGTPLPDDAILALAHDTFLTPIYVHRFGWKQFVRMHSAAFLLMRATIAATFDNTRVFPHWKIKFANMLLQQVMFADKDTDQLLFFCYEPDSYLSSLAASALVPEYKPKASSSNSLLFRDNRYLYHPNLDLKFCSRIQPVESQFYRDLGWMKIRSTQLWGLEESLILDQVPMNGPKVDIGIYSSGFWARTEEGWRVDDLERVRRGEFLKNRWYLILLDMLHVTAELKRDHPELTVKIYPHPLELNLMQKHGITVPYFQFAQESGFEVQMEGRSSLAKFYEARIGMASQSTIIFDRLHHGMDSYFYVGKENWTSVEVKYLGEYARFGFTGMDDLRTKLKQNLGYVAD